MLHRTTTANDMKKRKRPSGMSSLLYEECPLHYFAVEFRVGELLYGVDRLDPSHCTSITPSHELSVPQETTGIWPLALALNAKLKHHNRKLALAEVVGR